MNAKRVLSGVFVLATALSLALSGCNKKDDGDGDDPGSGSGSAGSAGSGSGSGSGSGKKGGWAALLGLKTKKAAKAGAGGKGAGPVERLAPGASLAEVVKAFRGYQSCLDGLQASLPPDLGMDMLSYYNIPDALCRTREALSKNDVTACQRVVSYSLRNSCALIYAIYTKRPEDCPLSYPRRRGRDGYCLAMASRDPSLCRGSKKEKDEVRCKAILHKDAGECDQLTKPADRQVCKREFRRWSPSIGKVVASLDKSFKPHLELRFAGPAAGQMPQVARPTCARFGVVAPSHGEATMVNFCEYYPYGYRRSTTFGAYSSHRVKVNLAFKPPASGSKTVSFGTDATLTIKAGTYGRYAEFSSASGQITFAAFERKRGGRVTGTFKATLRRGTEQLVVDGRFDTYVRDLVSPTQLTYRYGRYGSRYGGGKYGLTNPFAPKPRGSLFGSGGGMGRNIGGGGLIGGRIGGGGSVRGGGIGISGSRRRYAALLSSATIKPVRVKGKIIGYAINSPRADSIWSRLGVLDGDVLIKVGNKLWVRTIGDVVKIRGVLRDARGSLVLQVQRAKRSKRLFVKKATIVQLQQDFYF
ncbi:MAG: hypothetical protein KC503_11510 [Myxococcales bacterium]|nr:hypothetical protein [Myxococcales bacterium]